jgi:SAM-dependent methyltransferase
MTTTTRELDRDRVEEFAGTLVDRYVGALITYMIDIGRRTRLFEAAAPGPATSTELAERAGLQERYVREWLGAVVTGGLMTYDARDRTYALPPEHAACLTGAGAANLAPMSQLITLLGGHVDSVTAAFRDGGGVPYELFGPRFTEVMDRLGRGTFDDLLVSEIVPIVPGLHDDLARGIRVADVGCGSGHAINLLAAAYPASRFVGYDLAGDAIERARDEARTLDLTNARFEVLDAVDLAPAEPYDVVLAFDAIHDQAAPATVLRRIRESLATGGRFVMLDIRAATDLADNLDHPMAPMLYGLSTLHCLTVSLAYGGTGLGAVWGEQLARQMLADAGFTDVSVAEVPGDPLNSLYVAR